MSNSETATREQLIDPLLRAAGWNLSDRTQVDFEIPADGYDKEPWNGITDYCLFLPSGEVLAIVEAKKTSRDPREGQEQLRIYLDKVAAREGQTFMPFGFMTNGKDVLYWDSGAENPRLVAGFFTSDDLKRLLFIRQNGMLALHSSSATRAEVILGDILERVGGIVLINWRIGHFAPGPHSCRLSSRAARYLRTGSHNSGSNLERWLIQTPTSRVVQTISKSRFEDLFGAAHQVK
jgi:hypothetical protein